MRCRTEYRLHSNVQRYLKNDLLSAREEACTMQTESDSGQNLGRRHKTEFQLMRQVRSSETVRFFC